MTTTATDDKLFTAQLGELNMDRDDTIREIRAALKRRSGKTWSVTGGRGTSYGWITIKAPPARCTWAERQIAGTSGYEPSHFEMYDTGEPGRCMSPDDTVELAALLDIEPHMASRCVLVPGGNDYYRDYVDRANGREPSVYGYPYWD